MAFFNRVGNLLKQTVNKHVRPELSGRNPSLFQAIRSMSSSSRLFVGGLSYNTDEMILREAFSQYGEVVEARIIMDRDTGRSRGFGFVTFTSTEAASSAIQAFDGQDLHGRRIRVNHATERARGGGFGGGFGAGGGGAGGGGGFNYGVQGSNYGRGGYEGGNFGGSDGGNFPSGNYSGGGGFGSNDQYPSSGSGGGGFGGANNYPSGVGSGYGSGDSVQADGDYGGSDSNPFSGSQSGFSTLSNDEATGTYGGDDQTGIDADNGDFVQHPVESNDRDENDEPNDYANTKA